MAWGVDDVQAAQQFEDAFVSAHEHMRTYRVDPETGEAPAHESGAVGVAMVLRRGVAILAHAGDARAIIARADDDGSVVAVNLTHDHKLDSPEELDRIEATGAYIRPGQEEPFFTPPRVYKSAMNPKLGPGLTMARSLGDIDADELGVRRSGSQLACLACAAGIGGGSWGCHVRGVPWGAERGGRGRGSW